MPANEPPHDEAQNRDKQKPAEPSYRDQNGSLYLPSAKDDEPFIPDRGFDGPA